MSYPWTLVTDTGRLRENNEDAGRAWPELHLFAIADGMGGHVAGEVASHVALQAVYDVVGHGRKPRNATQEEELLGAAAIAANDAVLREADVRELDGMGTTLTVLRVRNRTAVASHVGDTRLYLVTPSEILQLTKDHNMVALLVEAGAVKPEDAHLHPDRHLLTRAIGTHPELEPDTLRARIPRGARLLLSSDGLHDVVPEPEIHRLASDASMESGARAMIEAANREGGPDNITVLMLEP